MLQLIWTETALEDLQYWQEHDNKLLKKIIQLCLDSCKTPTQGLGKPEALKHEFQGYWRGVLIRNTGLYTHLTAFR